MTASRTGLALAALNGLMAVAAGAFGAHAVSDPLVKDWLRTGAQYQLVHAVAALTCLPLGGRAAAWATRLFGVGALVFGGSLYLLAVTGARLWGAATPLGGLLLMAGWTTLIWRALAKRRD